LYDKYDYESAARNIGEGSFFFLTSKNEL